MISMYSSLVWSSNSALDISGGTSLLDDMAILLFYSSSSLSPLLGSSDISTSAFSAFTGSVYHVAFSSPL